MGSGIARNLRRAGHIVTGYSRTSEHLARVTEHGVRPAASAAEAATDADCVLVTVSDDQALRAVTFGERGILAGLGRGAVLVDCGTTSLDLVQELKAATEAKACHYIDAPMTGSKLGAENGTLTLMVAGPLEVVEKVKPALTAISKHIVHVGTETGLAQAAKVCLNLSQAITLQGSLEAFGLAKKLGVPLDKLQELFENSAARSGVQSFKSPYLQRGDFAPHFRLALMQKDLHLALGEAHARRLPLPLTSAVAQVYDQAAAEGLGDQDFLATAQLLARWLKVTYQRIDEPE